MTPSSDPKPKRWYQHFNWWYVGGILLLVTLKAVAHIINNW